MMKAAFVLGLASFALGSVVSLDAAAQSSPFQPGRVIVGAERLFGLSFAKRRLVDGENDNVTTDSRTGVAFLWRRTPFTPYQVPRLAVDVDVWRGLTVGGTLGFYSESGSHETQAANGAHDERDSPSVTSFIVTPRVGYGLPITPWLAFWGRLGLTYYNHHTSDTQPMGMNGLLRREKTTESGLAVDLEPMFVLLPVDHLGFMFGPYADLPLSGSRSSSVTQNGVTSEPPDDKLKYTEFGLTFGLLGYFL